MSNIVNLSYPTAHVAVIEIRDEEKKNMLSMALFDEFVKAFDTINDNTDLRVVVMHGFGPYFLMGADQEILLADADLLHKIFFDIAPHNVMLDCNIPIISAMQGHALGAGLALGCYGDIIIMSEESLYSTMYLKHGFTSDMGSAFILPDTFGRPIAWEMLLTGNKYTGKDLKERGATPLIVKRADVIPKALDMAKKMSDAPQASLSKMKQYRSTTIRDQINKAVADEFEMLKQTYELDEVKDRIKQYFGSMPDKE